eukprot:scaffold591_cov176-Amphora_coffeaeformis.AAC.6
MMTRGGAEVAGRPCLDDWKVLQRHIEQASSEENTIVKICPGTILPLDDTQEDHWMYMRNVTNLTLQCGDHGRVDDGCVVDGGLHHIWMEKSGHIVVRGITFQRARLGSIWHVDVQDVHYEDCLWRDNQHSNIVYESSFVSEGGGAAINGYNADIFFTNSTFLVRTALDRQAHTSARCHHQLTYCTMTMMLAQSRALGCSQLGLFQRSL